MTPNDLKMKFIFLAQKSLKLSKTNETGLLLKRNRRSLNFDLASQKQSYRRKRDLVIFGLVT